MERSRPHATRQLYQDVDISGPAFSRYHVASRSLGTNNIGSWLRCRPLYRGVGHDRGDNNLIRPFISLDANYQSNGQNGNVLILQASILNIPVRPRSMDKVICLGVIQHTPEPAQTFSCLANCVRPGGELVIDVYAARLRSLFSWKYLLRPITKRMDNKGLYRIIQRAAPILLPVSELLFRRLGRFGPRLLPIMHYPSLGLPAELVRSWSILDTFDMYSPAHDHPQSIATVRSWFDAAGFVDVSVAYGLNGIVARGRRPSAP